MNNNKNRLIYLIYLFIAGIIGFTIAILLNGLFTDQDKPLQESSLKLGETTSTTAEKVEDHIEKVEEPLKNDYYQYAIDVQNIAVALTKTASSNSDWDLIKSNWIQALEYAERVPVEDTNYSLAKKKISEYQAIIGNINTNTEKVDTKKSQRTVEKSNDNTSSALKISLTPELAYDYGYKIGAKHCEFADKVKTYEELTEKVFDSSGSEASNSAIRDEILKRRRVYGESDTIVQARERGLQGGRFPCEDKVQELWCLSSKECQSMKQTLIKHREEVLKQRDELLIQRELLRTMPERIENKIKNTPPFLTEPILK